jgi:hypothetical protein
MIVNQDEGGGRGQFHAITRYLPGETEENRYIGVECKINSRRPALIYKKLFCLTEATNEHLQLRMR